jgi:HSP20 family protein
MYNELISLFNLFGESEEYKPLRTFSKSEDDKYIIMAEVPGIPKEQLNVEYKNGNLVISAEYDQEFRKGKYKATYRIDGIDEEGIEAKTVDGVLTVLLPKKKEEQIKKIEIK